MEEIVNKVAQSQLVTINLEDYLPKEEIIAFDLKDYLFMELVLKEKDFRAALLNTDWTKYENKNVAIICSSDAIIPVWAYMLAASYLQPVALNIALEDIAAFQKKILLNNIANINVEEFRDQRIVVKGCGDVPIPSEAYVEITRLLRPVAKSIMYGEPCSTVPVFKKK